MINKKFLGFNILVIGFFTYCFHPITTYDTRYSQHVNTPISESLAPGRIFLIDRNGKVITDKAYPNGYYKFIDTDIESSFVQALIEIEDKNYNSHYGINLPAKLRAFRDNFGGKRVSGGSTITEQYIKNKYFKNTHRSYLQKAREAVLALYFSLPERGSLFQEQKEHILNIYYHDVYFGNNLYGVGSALEVYFGKEKLEELTEEEIVILLSLLNNPSISTLEETYFQEYFQQVKERLGYEFERTYFGKLPKKENIDKFPFVTLNSNKLLMLSLSNSLTPDDEKHTYSPSLREMSRRTEGVFGGDEMSVGQREVTIDSELQSFSREILQETLGELKTKNVTNGAVFALLPNSGEILIYQGSKDFYARDIDGQVDVVNSLRQPGSTVKPFLYLMALESGANPDDLLFDIESEYNSFQDGKIYISENYSLKEYGLIRLKKALGNSFNNATVRLARELELQKVFEFYQKYGFTFSFGAEHYGYSLVLGNAEITLETLVRNYAKLLNLEDENKFLLYDILSDSDNRDVSFGVNSLLSTSIPQAVKTGTSSDFRDNWVISYHPDLVLGVWVGNNNSSSMQGVTGISGAGYIWYQIIEKAISMGYITNKKIKVPEGIPEREYCLDAGCYRKEIIYTKGEKTYQSRLRDERYSESDIFEKLSAFEQERLRELGISIQK